MLLCHNMCVSTQYSERISCHYHEQWSTERTGVCVCQQFLSPDWFWIIGFIFYKSADGRRPRILHSYHPPLWPAAAPSNIMGKWKMEFSCRNIRHSVIRTFEYPVNMSSVVATSQTFSNIFCEWLFSHWHSFFLLMKLQKPEIFN